MSKIKKNTGINMFTVLLVLCTAITLVNTAPQFIEPLYCSGQNTLSPIDINFPLTYKKFKININVKQNRDLFLTKMRHNILRIRGLKGTVSMNGKASLVKKAYILSPSAHHYGGNKFDMEFLIVTSEYSFVTFIEAQKGEGNAFLQSLGFGSGGIKALELGKKIKIGDVESVQNMITKENSFLFYEGQGLFGKCEKTKYIINPDIVYCGLNDVKELKNGGVTGKLNAFFLKERSKNSMIFQNYEAPDKGKSKTFTHRPKKDIEAEKKIQEKKQKQLEKASVIIGDPQMAKKIKSTIPSSMKSPYTKAQISRSNGMHSHPRYSPVKTRKQKKIEKLQTKKKLKKMRIQRSKLVKQHMKNQEKKKIMEDKKKQKKLSKQLEYNQDAYNYFYRYYPKPRNGIAPREPEKYPSPRYPYPDTSLWTGEPNYPNDINFPDFIFPPQPPMFSQEDWPTDQEIDWKTRVYPHQWPKKRIPHALNENTRWLDPKFQKNPKHKHQDPKSKSQGIKKVKAISLAQSALRRFGLPHFSFLAQTVEPEDDDPIIPSLLDDPAFFDPDWDPFKNDPFFNPEDEPDFGYPIWPDGVNPSFPNYRPHYPTKKDPPIVVESPPYVIFLIPPSPKSPKKPLKKPPKYGVPNHPSDIPSIPNKPKFQPKMPPTFIIPPKPRREPEEPNQIDKPPKKPAYPRDPHLKWPQNPYYTWPVDPDYEYPKDPRFKYPKKPTDPKSPWPKDPRRDPRWHNPSDPSWLPKPRAPKYPQKSPKKVMVPKIPIYTPKKPKKKGKKPVKPKQNKTIKPKPKKKPKNPIKKSPLPIDPKKPLPAPKVTINRPNKKPVVLRSPPKNKIPKKKPKQPKKNKPKFFLRKRPVRRPKHPKDHTPYFFNPYNPYESPDPKNPVKNKRPPPRPFYIPKIPKKPRSTSPLYNNPKPNYVYMQPHRPPPFVAPKHFHPRIYKGVPNQPLGLIPPKGIPYWKPKPKDVHFKPEKTPPVPRIKDKKGNPGKWIPFFHYPIPFKTKDKKRKPVYVPQFIYVPKSFNPIKGKEPDNIPVLITPILKRDKPYGKPNHLEEYKMPILNKPIDPQLRKLLKHHNKLRKVVKLRKKYNKKMKQNKSYRPPRPCKEEDIFCRRVQHRNLVANKHKELRRIQRICKNRRNIRRCYTDLKDRLFRHRPEYANDWPEIPIYNPKKFKFMGFTKKCKSWYVGVIMNRHFIHKKQWKIKDYTYDRKGKVKYCKGYFIGPVFKRISYGGRFGKAYLAKLKASDVSELCKQNLGIVLNNKTFKSGRIHKDKFYKDCILKFGDGSVGKMSQMIKDPNVREINAFEFDKMTVEKFGQNQ